MSFFDDCVVNTLTLCSQLEDIHVLVCNSYMLQFCDLSAVYLSLYETLQWLKDLYVSFYNETSFALRISEREPFDAVPNAIANLLSVNLTQQKKFRIIIFILHLFVRELTRVICIDIFIFETSEEDGILA